MWPLGQSVFGISLLEFLEALPGHLGVSPRVLEIGFGDRPVFICVVLLGCRLQVSS